MSLAAIRDHRDELQRELTQLRSQLAASDLERIRLRAGLLAAIRILDGVDWLTFPGGCDLQEQREREIAELRKLVQR